MKDIFSSPKYLREQALDFYKMMGHKPDWELSDDKINRKIDLAFKGLFHIYLKTNHLTDDDRLQMEAIIVEFTHRKMLVELLEVKQ